MEQIPTELDDLLETPLIESQWPTLEDYLEEYCQQMGSQGDGLKTYFKEFDEDLDGLRGIVIVGGEPGSGKTALVLQIGFDTAIDERPVVIYSFEMPKAQLVTRLFQRVGKIKFKKLQKRPESLLEDDLQQFVKAKETIAKASSRITIRETKDFFEKGTNGSVNAIFDFAEEIRQLNRITELYGKPPLVIIDSLHEIPVDQKYGRELKQKIDYIMLNLRNMCDQTGATFLLISHQSRNGQKEQGLTSFLGSASIEYTVDMALTVGKPQDAEKTAFAPGQTEDRELTVAKNRYGPRPKALLVFDGQYMDFTFMCRLSSGN
ncbi:DnaB helicase C-terminal domain-containing protein [Spirosoma sp. RP8]|uniref:DnaB helicase C-terminal domain-containing protein n=1 Tax=Spirosoma liriopis TaxID=2937440 RepID=A0ABT0HWP4_9BACT|nr:DnaB-like helicase C-terminal domain-containing protein [Spirosoma liriopis]MCK8496043.1 DnaB helicase C-terminal domain-containing protein [Spirosoma liriopis]